MPEEKDRYDYEASMESQKELAEVKKFRHEAEENGKLNLDAFGTEPHREPEKPKTFWKKLENFWYHSKGKTFAFSFIGFMIVILIYDVVTREHYDFEFVISTKYYISTVIENMDEDIAQLVETDIDGNGEVKVNLSELSFWYDPADAQEIINDETLDTLLMTRDKLFTHLTAGDTFLFMIDIDTYDMLVLANEGESLFVDLSEYYTSRAIDGDKLILDQTELGLKWKMDYLDEDIYLCIRKIGGTAEDNEKNNASVNALIRMVGKILGEEPQKEIG